MTIGLASAENHHIMLGSGQTTLNIMPRKFLDCLLFYVVMGVSCIYGEVNLISWKVCCTMRYKIEILCMLFCLLSVPLGNSLNQKKHDLLSDAEIIFQKLIDDYPLWI